jgi:hypothetical protein
MNKNIMKIVLIGIAAGFCVSAKAVPEKKQKQTVAKCDKKDKSCGKKCKGKCQSTNNSYNTVSNEEDIRNNYSNEKYTFGSDEIAAKRKSAAQKVMEGY